MMIDSDLFVSLTSRANAQMKLVCFPFAGGNASIFHSLANAVDDRVEVVSLQLPGRGRFIHCEPYMDMDALIQDALNAFLPTLDRPCLFFGYSLGAKIAYELAVKLDEICFPLPLHFIAAASPAPHLPRRIPNIHHLSDVALKQQLVAYQGTPEEVLNNEDMMRLVLPSIRADFALLEKKRSPKKHALPTALSVLGGKADNKILTQDLLAWNELFENPQAEHWFDGGHFFIDECTPDLASVINTICLQELQRC